MFRAPTLWMMGETYTLTFHISCVFDLVGRYYVTGLLAFHTAVPEPCSSMAAHIPGPLITIHEGPRITGFTIKDRGRATLIYIHAVCSAFPIKVPSLTLQLCQK